MKRHIKTSLGTSDEFYCNTPNDPLILGEIQGKPDVPTHWALKSSTLLDAHGSLYKGITLVRWSWHPKMQRRIRR